jgi:hypothetical protein
VLFIIYSRQDCLTALTEFDWTAFDILSLQIAIALVVNRLVYPDLKD